MKFVFLFACLFCFLIEHAVCRNFSKNHKKLTEFHVIACMMIMIICNLFNRHFTFRCAASGIWAAKNKIYKFIWYARTKLYTRQDDPSNICSLFSSYTGSRLTTESSVFYLSPVNMLIGLISDDDYQMLFCLQLPLYVSVQLQPCRAVWVNTACLTVASIALCDPVNFTGRPRSAPRIPHPQTNAVDFSPANAQSRRWCASRYLSVSLACCTSPAVQVTRTNDCIRPSRRTETTLP